MLQISEAVSVQYAERADYGRSGAQYKKITVKTFSITLLIVLLSFQFILKIAPSTTVAFPDSSGEPAGSTATTLTAGFCAFR